MILVRRIINRIMMACIALFTLSGCNAIYEDEGDCDPHYKVKFRFDRNMLYADAFSTQVNEVDLYVFDQEGKLIWKGHEEGETLADEGYLMDLPVAPGTYDFVAWCRKTHEDAAGFNLSGGEEPQSFDHLRMRMEREYDGDQAHSTTDLHALFHGKVTNQTLPENEGTYIVTVPLTKDTNSVRIMLVHLSGKEIKSGDFNFKITDNNGHLNHDNSILEDEHVEYRSWSKKEGLASTVLPVVSSPKMANSIEPLASLTRDGSTVHSLVAEMTTSRLQTSQKPMLTITRTSDGEKVVNIPILDYFMMVKGEYNRNMEDDEYLDRQDEYNMTFFMNEDGSWYNAVLDILQWRVVLQNTDL